MTVKSETAGSHFTKIAEVSRCLNANFLLVGGALKPMATAKRSETKFCSRTRVTVAGNAFVATLFKIFLHRATPRRRRVCSSFRRLAAEEKALCLLERSRAAQGSGVSARRPTWRWR